jgi:hypothetical protein
MADTGLRVSPGCATRSARLSPVSRARSIDTCGHRAAIIRARPGSSEYTQRSGLRRERLVPR